jgi:cell division protease FtsH
MTPGATGATIKDLVNEAVLVALREGRDVVTWADVLQARYLRRVGEHEQVEYVERERHAFAIHEASHAVTAHLRRRSMEIDFVSIEPGSGYYGVVMSNKSDDTFVNWRSMYEIDILVSLASLAGERMFFEGDSTSGVSGDLRSATYFATVMESALGMGDTIAAQSVIQELAGGGGGYATPIDKDDSEGRHRASMGNRIEMRLARILDEATKVLHENRLMVLAIAHALETHKTISGEDVAAIFEGRQGPKVNGRDYHHPSFLEVADRYHNEALVAHRQTGRVELPLPVLARGNPQMAASSHQLPPPHSGHRRG